MRRADSANFTFIEGAAGLGFARVFTFIAASALLCALGCQGKVEQPGAWPDGVAAAGSSGGLPAAGGSGAAAAASGRGGVMAGNGGSTVLPARIRRLTNAEFDASIKSLLDIDSKFGASFTPDSRQDSFTRNDAQRVDPVFITQLSDAAQKLAEQARPRIAQLAPCATASGSEACARSFLENFATRAYRRPATAREVDALLAVYKIGAEGAGYPDGVVATIQAVLQSPGFLYVTELGATPGQPGAMLTEYEIASALAYLLTGAPPDDALQKAAAAGQLHAPDARQMQAERLLATQPAAQQITRMVEEWLGIDRITETAKDSNVYPEFAGLRDAMKHEADSFISEVMWKSKAGVSELLSANWTTAEDALARVYLNLPSGQGITRSDGRVSLSGVRRRGILDQAAFLSVYAHATESAPVLRGVALLRRVACVDLPSPTSLNINVVPPVPDPSKTTRERFTVHSRDPACAGCHSRIDALGFTFENLDAMGRERKTENGRAIDSATTLAAGLSFDGSYPDSAALAEKLAENSEVQACFARHLFRYAAARSDAASQGAEGEFMTRVAALPTAAQGKFAEILLAYIASDAFIVRGVGP